MCTQTKTEFTLEDLVDSDPYNDSDPLIDSDPLNDVDPLIDSDTFISGIDSLAEPNVQLDSLLTPE